MKRFLLGDLSESERAELEDRFLEEGDFFQELLSGEDDLVDSYVRGELTEPERALFERRFLVTPEGRRRIEFARTLNNSTLVEPRTIVAYTPEQKRVSTGRRSFFGKFAARRPALGFALAAALLVVVFGGLWFLMNRMRTRPASQQVQANQGATTGQPQESPSPLRATRQEEPSPQEKETPATPAPSTQTPKRPAVTVASFTLLPGMVRGEGGSQLNLSAGATEVRLRLGLEGEAYKKYRATLHTPEGKQLWSRVVAGMSSMKSAYLTLSFPANLLKGGDYVMALSGANADGNWESVADYSFRVVKK